MKEKFIAIGDIHGCIDQLIEILESISFYPEHKIIFLGDYINRGPDPNEVINQIRSIPGIYLMGNHEWMLIEEMNFVKNSSIDQEKILQNHKLTRGNFEWLEKETKYSFETDDYFFSHAGVHDEYSLSDQKPEDLLMIGHRDDMSHVTDKFIVHGHIPYPKVRIVGNNICVDTGAGFGGYLSAVVLPELIILRSKTRYIP